jgi:hypothetical protein
MHIDIKIQQGSKLKKIFHKLCDTLEDFIFSIVEKLPERLIPSKMMDRVERYLNKRIQQLEQQNIEDTCRLEYLDKFIDEKGIK